MKKKASLFYKIYFTLIILFFVLLIPFLICLSSWVSNYNDSLPETISQRFFDSVFKGADADTILELSGVDVSEFETVDDLKSFLSEKLDNLSYTSVATGNDNTKRYVVKADDLKIADYTLEKKGEKWEAVAIQLHLDTITKQIKILSGTSLYINGIKVNDSYITNKTDGEWKAYLPEDVPSPEWITYTISNLTKEPKIRLVDKNGAEPKLTEENGVLIEEIIYDKDEDDVISRIVNGAKQYAMCMQNDATKSSVFDYFERGTELYNKILYVENTFVWDHNGYDFENIKASEFTRYDENTVSLRVSFIHILKMHGREDYRNPTDITYFAHLVNGEYKIFEMHNN